MPHLATAVTSLTWTLSGDVLTQTVVAPEHLHVALPGSMALLPALPANLPGRDPCRHLLTVLLYLVVIPEPFPLCCLHIFTVLLHLVPVPDLLLCFLLFVIGLCLSSV